MFELGEQFTKGLGKLILVLDEVYSPKRIRRGSSFRRAPKDEIKDILRASIWNMQVQPRRNAGVVS